MNKQATYSHMQVVIDSELRQRIKMQLAIENKTFKQLFCELFENYLQENN